nr:unnamed protein product [Spirometra erinaceieuropaei]
MIEHFYCRRKMALCATEDPTNRSSRSPLTLLGIRASQNLGLVFSAARLILGSALRLPVEMVVVTTRGADENPCNFVHRLRQFMRSLLPGQPRSSPTGWYVGKALDDCTHVLVRRDRVRRILESPCERPFQVLSRTAKTCWIIWGDKENMISINQVKAAIPNEPPDLRRGERCQERYHSLAPMYYRGAQAAVVVYDITNLQSYNRAMEWVTELRDRAPGVKVIALAGNKCDLHQQRLVATQDAEAYAQEHGLLFMETSAKTATNVMQLFTAIAEALPYNEQPAPDVGGQRLNEAQGRSSASGCCK